MTDRDSTEKERLERATCSDRSPPLDDAELADLVDGWRVLTDALAPVRESALDEELLVSQVRWRARRATIWRGARLLLAASVLLAVVAVWPKRAPQVAKVALPKSAEPTTAVTEVAETPASTQDVGSPWNDELEKELLEIEAEVHRVERRWRTPPDSFASVRWRMQELEEQVTQSSL